MFSRVTFAGLIVNFAAIPLMTLVQIAGHGRGRADVAVGPSSRDAAGWIAHLAVEGLIGSAALVDVLPWLTRRLAPPPLWVMAVYYASLIGVASASFVVPTFRSAVAAIGALAIAARLLDRRNANACHPSPQDPCA